MYFKKKIAFQIFAFCKTPKRKKTQKNVILKLHFPDVFSDNSTNSCDFLSSSFPYRIR